MKKLITTLSVLLIAGALFAETGYDIMKKADEVAEPKLPLQLLLSQFIQRKVQTESAK